MLWKWMVGPGLHLALSIFCCAYCSQWVRCHQAGARLSGLVLSRHSSCSPVSHSSLSPGTWDDSLSPPPWARSYDLVLANGLWAEVLRVALRPEHLSADVRPSSSACHWHGNHRNLV